GGTAKVFLIAPGQIEEVVGLLDEPQRPAEVLRAILTLNGEQSGSEIDTLAAERIGVVAHHLFSGKRTGGIFLRLDETDEKALLKAYRDLRKQPPRGEETEGEGVLKELQAL